MYLLHDNAASHKAGSVTLFLKKSGVYVLEHPPYSPDLAPLCFFLFPQIKKKLTGRNYTSCQKLGVAIFNLFKDIAEKDYEKAFRNWTILFTVCIQTDRPEQTV